MSREPLLTSVVGSHARPSWFVSGIAAAERGEFGPADLEEMLDDAVDLAIRDQEEAGIDIVSDGEMRRAGFFTAEFYRHVTGVVRAATRPPAGRRGARPAASLRGRRADRRARRSRRRRRVSRSPGRATTQPLKVTLPGPYTLSGRLTYGPGEVYSDRNDAAEAFVPILRAELEGLVAAGADFIQIDEPSPAIHPEAPADFSALFNAAVEPIVGRARLGAHLCFGNYLGRPLARRTYRPVLDAMLGFHVDELVLEFANREMAEVDDPRRDRRRRPRMSRAGVIDVKNSYLETADDVAERIDAGAGRGRSGRAASPSSPIAASARRHARRPAPSCGRWSPDATSCSDGPGGRSHEGSMDGHAITMLGTGLIAEFYTNTLHGQRGRDRVRVVYSRSAERGEAFRDRWGIPESTTDLEAAVSHPDTDVVVIALPNFLHEEAVELIAKAGKAILCTKPLGRTADEARRMLATVESAGVFGGYLEDLCYTPKSLKAVASVQAGAIGDVTWVRSRETHPGPALGLVLGRPADRRRRDHRPRLPLHRDHPQLRRQGKPAGRGAVPHRHPRPPDRRRGQRGRADPLRVRRDRPVRGELDVPRRDGPARRGGRHARDDLDEPLPADRVRDVQRARVGRRLRGREGREHVRLALPGRRRGVGARLRGHVQRHVPARSTRVARRARRSTTATS